MDVQGLGTELFATWTVGNLVSLSLIQWLISYDRQTICTFLFLESHRKVYRQIKSLDN